MLKKFGTYRASVKCPNCNFNSEIKIPKGTSVAEHIKGGKCKCDNCQVVFFPEEYTTDHFEKEKKKDMNINLMENTVKRTDIKTLPKKEFKEIKWI